MNLFFVGFICLCSFLFGEQSFSEYKNKSVNKQNLYVSRQEELFKYYIVEQDSSFINYKKEIEKKWNEYIISSQTSWVVYSKNFNERLIVNFRDGELVVEAVSNNKVKAVESLKRMLQSMLLVKTEMGNSILLNQLSFYNKKPQKEVNKESRDLFKDIKDKKSNSQNIEKKVLIFLNSKQSKEVKLVKSDDINKIIPKLIKKVESQNKVNGIKTLKNTLNKLQNIQAENQNPIRENQIDKFVDNSVKKVEKLAKLSNKNEKKIKYKIKLDFIPNHLQKRINNYKPLIEKYCEEFKIDSAVALAIIHTESYFNPKAYNRHGNAYGMMQIVPRYAGKTMNKYLYNINRKPNASKLYNPDYNLKMGIGYLRWLSDNKWNEVNNKTNRYYAVICSYNGGTGSVYKALTGKMKNISKNKWKEMMMELSNSDSERLLIKLKRKIPWQETRKYIDNVTERMKTIYGYKE